MRLSSKKGDTEQLKRMKELALNSAYFNSGEILKLLNNNEEINHLIKKIRKGSIKLKSDLIFGKLEITTEEKFLENLDCYITYVKNNYHIDCVEQYLLLELGLDNNYAKECLLSHSDFHSDDNYKIYFNYFRRMFLYNFIQNIKYYNSNIKNLESINRLYNELEYFNFNNDKDLIYIEKILKDIINDRENNLFNCFVLYKNHKTKKDLLFQAEQLELVLSNYYSSIEKEEYTIKNDDNYIETNISKVLFNICNDYKHCRLKDYVIIEFGVFDKLIKSRTKNIMLKREEFDIIYEMLDDIVNKNKEYSDIIDFDDDTLEFKFSISGGNSFLKITYDFTDGCGGSYNIGMVKEDIINLYNIIIKQIKE